MSSDFAPELRAHEYGPTPEDSMHRSLDDHLKHPASGEVAAVVDGTAPGVGVDTCRHGLPEDGCASCAACAACRGECGVCPYATPAPLADAPDDVEALAYQIAKAQWDEFEASYWEHEVDHRDFDTALELPPWEEGTAVGHLHEVTDTLRRAFALLAARDADLTARAEARGAARALSEVAAHGVALDKGRGIVCLCGETFNPGTLFARHLREVRAAAASYTRDGADGEAVCCCESSPPPEFGGNLPDRECPTHGDPS